MNLFTTQEAKLDEPIRIYFGRWSRWFILSAGWILLATGLAKIVSSLGYAKVLYLVDPIFGISFRQLMFFVGLVELGVSAVCLFTTRWNLSLSLVIWMATNFTVYRFGLWWIKWNHPCSCLGNLTDAIRISPYTTGWIMKIISIYLLVGSFAIMVRSNMLASLIISKFKKYLS